MNTGTTGIYAHMNLWLHAYIYTRTHECMHVCKQACMNECKLLCMYACMHAHMNLWLHACKHACMNECWSKIGGSERMNRWNFSKSIPALLSKVPLKIKIFESEWPAHIEKVINNKNMNFHEDPMRGSWSKIGGTEMLMMMKEKEEEEDRKHI